MAAMPCGWNQHGHSLVCTLPVLSLPVASLGREIRQECADFRCCIYMAPSCCWGSSCDNILEILESSHLLRAYVHTSDTCQCPHLIIFLSPGQGAILTRCMCHMSHLYRIVTPTTNGIVGLEQYPNLSLPHPCPRAQCCQFVTVR